MGTEKVETRNICLIRVETRSFHCVKTVVHDRRPLSPGCVTHKCGGSITLFYNHDVTSFWLIWDTSQRAYIIMVHDFITIWDRDLGFGGMCGICVCSSWTEY